MFYLSAICRLYTNATCEKKNSLSTKECLRIRYMHYTHFAFFRFSFFLYFFPLFSILQSLLDCYSVKNRGLNFKHTHPGATDNKLHLNQERATKGEPTKPYCAYDNTLALRISLLSFATFFSGVGSPFHTTSTSNRIPNQKYIHFFNQSPFLTSKEANCLEKLFLLLKSTSTISLFYYLFASFKTIPFRGAPPGSLLDP